MTNNSGSLRTLVIFNLGPPFGGFRLAINPRVLGLHRADRFRTLEAAVRIAFARIECVPPDRWSQLPEELDGDPELNALGPGRGVIDFHKVDDADGTCNLIGRAFQPFTFWPLGGWAIYEGRHFASNGGGVTPFTDDELTEFW